MAKPLVGELNIIGFTLRPSFGVLYAIEQRTGRDIHELAANLLGAKLPFKKTTLRFLLYGLGYREEEFANMYPRDVKQLPQIDWDDMLRIATGMMGYTAKEFWRMTMLEFMRAYEGFCLLHGIEAASTAAPATSHDLAELLKQFPDVR
jgi:hypothetical protein